MAGPTVGVQAQGQKNQGPSVGYDPVPIPKVLANTQLDIGGIIVNSNQRMPEGMNTVAYEYVPAGRGSIHGPGYTGDDVGPVAPTPGKTNHKTIRGFRDR